MYTSLFSWSVLTSIGISEGRSVKTHVLGNFVDVVNLFQMTILLAYNSEIYLKDLPLAPNRYFVL